MDNCTLFFPLSYPVRGWNTEQYSRWYCAAIFVELLFAPNLPLVLLRAESRQRIIFHGPGQFTIGIFGESEYISATTLGPEVRFGRIRPNTIYKVG
jgi:hypothetical protein